MFLSTGLTNARTEGTNRLIKQMKRPRLPEPGQLPAPSTVALHPAHPPIVSEEPNGARLKIEEPEKQPGYRPVSVFYPSATLPVHPTALGRALLAFCPAGTTDAVIAKGLRPYTQHTITSPDRLRRALAVTRLTRVAVTRFEPPGA